MKHKKWIAELRADRNWAKFFRVVTIMMMFSAFMQVPAFASGDEMAQFKTQIIRIYNLIASLMLPMATVGFAYSCAACLFGNQRDIQKASRQILYLLIAIVCIHLVPLVASAATSLFSSFTYTPPTTFDQSREITF